MKQKLALISFLSCLCGPVLGIFLLTIILLLGGCSKKKTKVVPEMDFAPVVEKQIVEPAPEPKPEPAPIVIEMEPVEPEIIEIRFPFDEAVPLPQEAMKLDHLIGRCGEVSIDGYTCSIGLNEYNLGLGLERAEWIRRYISCGSVNSFGEEKCMAPCKTIDESECAACRKAIVKVTQ